MQQRKSEETKRAMRNAATGMTNNAEMGETGPHARRAPGRMRWLRAAVRRAGVLGRQPVAPATCTPGQLEPARPSGQLLERASSLSIVDMLTLLHPAFASRSLAVTRLLVAPRLLRCSLAHSCSLAARCLLAHSLCRSLIVHARSLILLSLLLGVGVCSSLAAALGFRVVDHCLHWV